MVGKKQARQFHQALYSINQKSSDLKKWEALGQAPKLDTAYKWDIKTPAHHMVANFQTQGGEVHLQIRAPVCRQGRNPPVWREVHWFWHDQKHAGEFEQSDVNIISEIKSSL